MAELSIQAVKKAQLQIEDQPLDTIAEKLTRRSGFLSLPKEIPQITARKFQNKLVKLNRFLILAEE